MLIHEESDCSTGIEQAWETLLQLNHDNVYERLGIDFHKSYGCYALPLFNERVFISPEQKKLWGESWVVDLVLTKLATYSVLSILGYLIYAKDIPLSGNLINPRELGGGLIFTSGSHILPLNKLVDKYTHDVQGFIRKGLQYGARQMSYGDACIKLSPFPKIPVIFIIWEQDEEFPARADILFDSTCSEHLPTDILWSTAMTSVLMMLQ